MPALARDHPTRPAYETGNLCASCQMDQRQSLASPQSLELMFLHQEPCGQVGHELRWFIARHDHVPLCRRYYKRHTSGRRAAPVAIFAAKFCCTNTRPRSSESRGARENRPPSDLMAEENPFSARSTSALAHGASAWASTIDASTRSMLVRRLHCHKNADEFSVNAKLADIHLNTCPICNRSDAFPLDGMAPCRRL
jgi:hypothetical protein